MAPRVPHPDEQVECALPRFAGLHGARGGAVHQGGVRQTAEARVGHHRRYASGGTHASPRRQRLRTRAPGVAPPGRHGRVDLPHQLPRCRGARDHAPENRQVAGGTGRRVSWECRVAPHHDARHREQDARRGRGLSGESRLDFRADGRACCGGGRRARYGGRGRSRAHQGSPHGHGDGGGRGARPRGRGPPHERWKEGREKPGGPDAASAGGSAAQHALRDHDFAPR
mmetsp:Transcript_4835/g.11007  ORF Transcript_4835/g.11007 Transcript_4835/m.11007 type:complete len:227 (+) Transcript_4835:421-1101(+)